MFTHMSSKAGIQKMEKKEVAATKKTPGKLKKGPQQENKLLLQ